MSEIDAPSSVDVFGRKLREGSNDVTHVVRRVLDNSHALLPAADHVSITLGPPGQWRTLAASTGLARALDHAQYRSSDGPCVQAASRPGSLYSGDLGHDERWPAWSSASAFLGVRSVLSISLALSPAPFGSLNLYSAALSAFTSAEQLELAPTLAAHVVAALHGAESGSDLTGMPAPREPS